MEEEEYVIDPFYSIIEECSKTNKVLETLKEEQDRVNAILNTMLANEATGHSIKLPGFDHGCEWYNVNRPLTLDDLRGKITVVDFFTYCCINCMHILPALHHVESKYHVTDGVVVLGVHTAKFTAERISDNVSAAVERYGITHPVINDTRALWWNALNVTCWPTIVVLGPTLQPLFAWLGEGSVQYLDLYIHVARKYFESDINFCSLPVLPTKHVLPGSLLSYPGKVCDLHPDFLAVSDTGNHRIVLSDRTGKVKHIIGGPEAGFLDGSANMAKFDSPQGITYHCPTKSFYVSDTENHVIRTIAVDTWEVSTLTGIGRRGEDLQGGKLGLSQALSSPWDVCVSKHFDEKVLFIAMAGTHQIWAYFFSKATLWKNKTCPARTCICVAGSGAEENRNNAYSHRAGFAQPSEIVEVEHWLYIADSESSSIRRLNLLDGSVTGVAGGTKNPTDLFAFGDCDSQNGPVRLQHPLGVAWSACKERLYIADSYNHKIKQIDVNTLECITVCKNVEFKEPGGLCSSTDGKFIYVADTNNHCVKMVEVDTEIVSKIEHSFDDVPDAASEKTKISHKQIFFSSEGGTITLNVTVKLTDDIKYAEAPQSWALQLPENNWKADRHKGQLEESCSILISVPPSCVNHKDSIVVVLNLVLCKSNSVCAMHKHSCKLDVVFTDMLPVSDANFEFLETIDDIF